MIRFLLKSFITILILLAIGWCYGLHRFLETVSHYPILGDKTDAIVIFTGEKGRIEQGVNLLKLYPNTPILISGVGHDQHSLPLIKTLEKEIVGDITLGRDARNTLGNAEETKKWVRERSIKSLRLVTSHYHMPRSLLLLQKALPDIRIIPHPIISPNFQSEKWWGTQKVYKMIIAEYNKFLVISIREMIGV